MKMKLNVAEGYRILKKEEIVGLNKLPDIFKNNGGDYISLIRRKDHEKAVILKHKIKCPHCGKTSPMYFPENYEDVNNEEMKTEKDIENWINGNREIFKNTAVMLSVRKFLDYSDEYHCYKCGKISQKSDNFCEVVIETTESEVVVRRSLKTLGEIAGVNWNKGDLLVAFPIYEQVRFNFSSGTVQIELISGGNIISEVVTNNNLNLKDDTLVRLISENKVFKRLLAKIFERKTKQKIVFDVNELDFQKFVNLTYFNGFLKDFYDAIPFKEGTTIIDESFKDLVKELRTPCKAMGLLKKSALPDCKSVRKIFATKSGLFFYIKECEMLYNFFKDVNLLCKVLNKESVFTFLINAHYYNLKPFLQDFGNVATKKMIVGVSEKVNMMTSYAIEYTSLSDYAKKQEQESWFLSEKKRENDRHYKEHFAEPSLSMPMHPVPQSAGVSVMGRYTFKWLRTKNDYNKASEELENCLYLWNPSRNPVAVVFSGEIMVAALEISGDKIVQLRGQRNRDISENSDLYKTISKWCALQQMTIATDINEIEDAHALPF